MACMCGDLCCWSCGPAQGNHRCPICGEWMTERCKHLTYRGTIRRRFKAEAESIAAAERAAEEEQERYWEAYRASEHFEG